MSTHQFNRKRASQEAQHICITFIQRRPNVFDVGPTLYKCYTNVLCLLIPLTLVADEKASVTPAAVTVELHYSIVEGEGLWRGDRGWFTTELSVTDRWGFYRLQFQYVMASFLQAIDLRVHVHQAYVHCLVEWACKE